MRLRRGRDINLAGDIVPVVVAAPDVREDLAGRRPDRDERAVVAPVAVFVLGDLLFHDLLCDILEPQVNRCRDAKAPLGNHLVARDIAGRLEESRSAHLGYLVLDVEDKVRSFDIDVVLHVIKRLRFCRFDLLHRERRLEHRRALLRSLVERRVRDLV